MFCPKCGTPEQTPDAYCKKCGTYLRDNSFRGWLLGGNNPGRAAWSITISSVLIAILCVCISILIIKTERSRDLTYLKYAFVLCWVIVGYLITLSLVSFRLWKKMLRAQGSLNQSTSANNFGGGAPSPDQRTKRLVGAESSGEADTELLSSTTREFEERKQVR